MNINTLALRGDATDGVEVEHLTRTFAAANDFTLLTPEKDRNGNPAVFHIYKSKDGEFLDVTQDNARWSIVFSTPPNKISKTSLQLNELKAGLLRLGLSQWKDE